MKRKSKVYLLLFGLGLSTGILFAVGKVKASSPEGEVSTAPINMYYDEYWQATNSVVSSASGFVEFNPSAHANTGTAAKLEKQNEDPVTGIFTGWIVRVFPKMVVTRWRVNGHIHME